MTVREEASRVTRAAARAAERTPGVAHPGVRVRPSGVGPDGRPGHRLELRLTVTAGHRALDVTRAVRQAVTAAVRDELGPRPGPVSVAVTVTGIV